MEREIILHSKIWELAVTGLGVLVIAAVTWVVATWLAKVGRGKTRFGLRGLERLVAPITLLVALAATRLVLARTTADPLVATTAVDLLGIVATVWLASRFLDVVWKTGTSSARLRAQPGARSALLAMRHLGKLALVVGLIAVLSVRLGVSEQFYLALGAVGAALAFAARDPISNALAFVEVLISPPFYLGDTVRIGDFRGGEDAVGVVVEISPFGLILRTRQRTEVIIPHLLLDSLRVENLSSADRRRLLLVVPIGEEMSAEALRDACDAIDADLQVSRFVSEYRRPHVWLSGWAEGLELKASVWLRRGTDRRNAQRELVILIRKRLEEHARRDRGER